MQIVTSSGKTFDAQWTLDMTTRHGANQLAMQLGGGTTISEIAQGLVGCAEIIAHKADGVKAVYEGYTLLSSVTYTYDRSAVRVVLEKP